MAALPVDENGEILDILDPKTFALVGKEDPGEVIELETLLDRGASAQVWQGLHVALTHDIAVKIIPKSVGGFAFIAIETQLLKQCKSPFITHYYGCWITEDEIWIAMELVALGSLESVMQIYKADAAIQERELASIMAYVLHALVYLHERLIVHRDVKAKNILLDTSGVVKLTDLGIASQMNNKNALLTEVIGSPHWMAPEVVLGIPYNTKSDIWSLGITLIELADGAPPHHDVPSMDVLRIIPEKGSPTLQEPQRWSSQMVDFLAQCVHPDMESRPSAKELLAHPFLKVAVDQIERNDATVMKDVALRVADLLDDWRKLDFEQMLNPRAEEFDPLVKRAYNINLSQERYREANRERSNEIRARMIENDQLAINIEEISVSQENNNYEFSTFGSDSFKQLNSNRRKASMEETGSANEAREQRMANKDYKAAIKRFAAKKKELAQRAVKMERRLSAIAKKDGHIDDFLSLLPTPRTKKPQK